MKTDNVIKAVGLTKIFRTESVQTTALNEVNLEIYPGEFVAIMGPSGCGKSTLLNIMGLLDNPTSGELWFMGQEVSRWKENDRTDLRNGNLGFVFQSFNLIDELTVFENVELPLLYAGVPVRERVERVNRALDRMQITHRSSSAAASNSVWPLRVPLSPIPKSSWPTSRQVTSTRPTATK